MRLASTVRRWIGRPEPIRNEREAERVPPGTVVRGPDGKHYMVQAVEWPGSGITELRSLADVLTYSVMIGPDYVRLDDLLREGGWVRFDDLHLDVLGYKLAAAIVDELRSLTVSREVVKRGA